MPYYEIIVQYPTGKPASGRKVCVGGTWGFSKEAYTDSSGKAVVEHSGTSVTVYVDGKNRGSANPGSHLVTL